MFLLALGARNLARAQAHGVETLICLCGSCTYELLRAKERIGNPFTEARINEMLAPEGLRYDAKKPLQVKHILEVLDAAPRRLQQLCTRKIRLRVAVQEPCNALRPAHLHPGLDGKCSLLRDITAFSGVSPVEFEYENGCCGGTMLAFDEPVGMELASLRYRALEKCGAQAIVTACPNCHSVYYVYPKAVDKKYAKAGSRLPPALFITQLIGLSMGMTSSETGLDRHMDRKYLLKLLD
jgi:heterodisulfide reductase subunit B